MRKTYAIVQGKVTECPPEEATIWTLFAPDEAERATLVHELHIDEHTLASALDPDEDPRMEVDEEYVALILNRPRRYRSVDNFTFKVDTQGLFLCAGKLIVVVSEEIAVFDDRRVFGHVGSLAEVMLKVMYRTTMHFMGHLKVINAISDELEAKANIAMDNRHLLAMFALGKSLVYFTTSIQANGTLIEKVRHAAAKLGLTQDEIWLLEDMQAENSQCARQSEIYSNILAGLMDARASLINNNMNQLMKRLTMVMIAVMWPALVSGFFSMNVQLPVPQHGTLLPFLLCLLIAFGPLIGIWLWTRRRRR